MKDTYVLMPHQGSCHPYMESFANALVKAGAHSKTDIRIQRTVRAAIGHMGFSFRLFNSTKHLVCLGSGRIESVVWPWCYFYEVIPVMWDVWPAYVDPLKRFIHRNKVKVMFCTSRQQAELLAREVPGLSALWMPEGVEVSLYPLGCKLSDRKIDVLEYGRKKQVVHDEIIKSFRGGKFNIVTERIPLVFETFTQYIRNSKISICFPQCDTNPLRAGNIETLTQRYWECMLSGTLVVGRAPQELIDLCGYNPVIEIEDGVSRTIRSVLSRIEEWQWLADKNRLVAEKIAGWDNRMNIVVQGIANTYGVKCGADYEVKGV